MRWRFEPASPPPPPAEVTPSPYPVPLGGVGQISFWAPNRGLLITGGTEAEHGPVPAGLYAYDGVTWHQLATVCGGAQGRIAWAGPDEFWTIAAQRAGQITSRGTDEGELESLSLCHFVGDTVVASYAMPLDEPDSYLKMDAAACLSSSDCWFAGEDGHAPNAGSFHLHWNGSQVSVVYDPSDHAVTGIVAFAGRFYEGLAIGPEDTHTAEEYLPAELESGVPPTRAPAHPPVIRTIAPGDQAQPCAGALAVFCDKTLFSGQPLPVYAEKSKPYAIGGFDLATDGSPLGAGATQLWAGADPLSSTPSESGPGKVTILHGTATGTWTQVFPAAGGATPLKGARLQGSETDEYRSQATAVGNAIAPVPGTESAWLSLSGEGDTARVELIEADGHEEEPVTLPESSEDVGDRGEAGPIACPALNDCWMVTNEGWLFHLSGGAAPGSDGDPVFDGEDGVISYRPPDAGVPAVYPDGFAEDDSLANQQPPPAPEGTPQTAPAATAKPAKAKPLLKNVKSRLLDHRTLRVTFTLTARAHVQLVARRHRRIVAETHRESLGPGAHKLLLDLDPARWPTKLSFEAKPIGGATEGSSDSSNAGDTIST